MALTIAVPKETAEFENRVAASPETVKKLKALGCDVIIEKGAGLNSSITDEMFLEAGAQIGSNITQNADIVLKVQANESDLSNFEKMPC